MPVNDLKACSWKREGERAPALRGGRNKCSTTKVTGYRNDVWMETQLAMNETALSCFPPGAEWLKTLDTPCSVSFFLAFSFSGFWELP